MNKNPPARKAVLAFGLTLDGYIARSNGAVNFLVADQEGMQLMTELFANVDAVIFGRKTLRGGADLGEAPQRPWTSYVFSRAVPPGERNGLVYVNQTPAEFIHKPRELPGKDIFPMGGGELARSFLAADLVDELVLGVVPILLGEGISAFPSGFPQRDFALIESKSNSNGSVTLKYGRTRAHAAPEF